MVGVASSNLVMPTTSKALEVNDFKGFCYLTITDNLHC